MQSSTKNSEYDQEIPQSQTADNSVAPHGRAARPSRDIRKTNLAQDTNGKVINFQYNWVNTYLKVIIWKIRSFEWIKYLLFWLYGSANFNYFILCYSMISTQT